MKIRMLTALALALFASGIASAQPARPTVPQVCQSCHKPEAGQIRGIYENIAFKTQSIQLKIDSVTEIVKFDPKTIKLQDGEEDKPNSELAKIAKHREARIEYTTKDGAKFATLISFKGPVRIAPERLVDFAAVDKLVAQGPEKGQYTLIDSRPLPRFQEATIPTAINLPYPAFDKFVDRLPKDKSKLVVFFCGGITCTMSPKSMQKVQAMGYTNAKVYREGMPEWSEKRPGVTSAAFFKAAFIDKGIPHVLIDVREPAEVRAGYIPGAVGIPAADVKSAIGQLPDRKLAAPILVYDGDNGQAARTMANAISAAGFPNVTVITGGFAGWKAAGNPIYAGDIGTKIAYKPMPRPGEISIDEFRHRQGDAARHPHPRRAQRRRGQERDDQGRAADPRRGPARADRRDPEGQAGHRPLPHRHTGRNGLPQAQGEGHQRGLPAGGHRHRRDGRLQDHAELRAVNGYRGVPVNLPGAGRSGHGGGIQALGSRSRLCRVALGRPVYCKILPGVSSAAPLQNSPRSQYK